MFRNLPLSEPSDVSLVRLGQAMIQQLEDGELDKDLGVDDDDENVTTLDGTALRLPAGYTYFGQYVDHDITFDPVSSLTRQDDPDALVDYRTPRFDLDSLYGRGPADQPYLYDDGVHLSLGTDLGDPEGTAGRDLPRTARGRAIIGDPRNDENLIVSQLQATFIRFHNAVVDIVAAEPQNAGRTTDEIFKLAQTSVRWHYQWVVIRDYLRRLVGDAVIADILPNEPYVASEDETAVPVAVPRLRFYHWHDQPYMPVEFSVAAYRFGHSMVRPSYRINDVAVTDPPVAGAHRIPLFDQTELPRQSLDGFRELPQQWGVQWKYFLPGVLGSDPTMANHLPQPSYKIDTALSHPLGALTNETAGPELVVAGFDPAIAQVLAVRNLLRGLRLGVPSGQDVARAMGIEPLTDDQLLASFGLEPAVHDDLVGRAPLWLYVLREAELLAGAGHLGPVGGRIVAEVLIGLLAGDPLSFLNVQPTWVPTLPAATAGSFTLSDIVNIAIPTPAAPPPPPPYQP